MDDAASGSPSTSIDRAGGRLLVILVVAAIPLAAAALRDGELGPGVYLPLHLVLGW